MQEKIESLLFELWENLEKLEFEEKVNQLNNIKSFLHSISPFENEPVDCVLWIKGDKIHANSYNPNNVAIPEFKLLEHSIECDGYTQPIVSMLEENGNREVIDGFHRNKIGKESSNIRNRIRGYLPVVTINKNREGINDRIASTIRHNRARGKHNVDLMSKIVMDLKRRNWTTNKISKELGMDADEVLRLSQISSLLEMFKDKEFSMTWEATDDNIT